MDPSPNLLHKAVNVPILRNIEQPPCLYYPPTVHFHALIVRVNPRVASHTHLTHRSRHMRALANRSAPVLPEPTHSILLPCC